MNNRKGLELLAPAKNADYGEVAIRYGADAVYIGAESFGARAAAGNSIADITRLCDYAHRFSAKVYATLNTIIFENELDDAYKLAVALYNAGCDALIVQDMAFLKMDLPPIRLFASTQAHNYELERIRFLEQVGFDRIILARELSLKQINAIRQGTEVDLEFFVHGALCVSFSGQCYISSYKTGRSGNRGECSQMCRLKYDLLDDSGNNLIKDKYLLSPKDLNLSNYIGELANAGISSFKIEGRLKDLNYLKNITAYYRQKIDAFIESSDFYTKDSIGSCHFDFNPQPERSFNRGFTDYNINGEVSNLVNTDSPKSFGMKLGKVIRTFNDKIFIRTNEKIISGDGLCFVGKDGRMDGFFVNETGDNYFIPNKIVTITEGTVIYRNQDYSFEKVLERDRTERYIGISIVSKKINELNYEFTVTDETGISASITISGKSKANNIDSIRCKTIEQISKTGNTIFKLNAIELNDFDLFLSISEINELRRQLLEKLITKRVESYQRISRTSFANSVVTVSDNSLDYSSNIANSLAEEFYLEHQFKIFEKAYELLDDKSNKVLMTTKHCLKKEIGRCPRTTSDQKLSNDKLFIRNSGRLYSLEFDCNECLMKIKAIQ